VMTVAFSMLAAKTQAASITYDLNYVFTSSGLPASTGTYLTATFTEVNSNTVELVLTSSLENANEFFSEFYFNSDETVSVSLPTVLSGTYGSSQGTITSIDQFNLDKYKADGTGGDFDVRIKFDTAPDADRFNLFDSLLFTITGSGITADTFNLTASGSNYYAAAHLQGTTPDCSSWVADRNGANNNAGGGAATGLTSCSSVPDSGSTLALLGVAMMGVGYLRSRFI
jgi:hypothetical protein